MSDAQKSFAWIVAAGTGGHIFPGLNVVDEFKRRHPDAEFLFFGDADRLEAKIIPGKGHRIEFLSAGRWKGTGPAARLLALVAVLAGTAQAFAKTFSRKPRFLLSVGGYVSVPVALACWLRGVPVFLLEPNILSGMANRLLSRIARAVFTTPGSDAKKKMKCPVFELGNPVRKDLRPIEIRRDVKRVLVLGGSQGALSLCRASLELMRDPVFHERGMDLFLQTGEKNLEQAREWQSEFDVGPWTQVAPFINDMADAIARSDLVVARAGAMTVAELALAGVPTIFVPFPFAADDHQRVNARILLDAGAAQMVDETAKDYAVELARLVKELCVDAGNFEKRQSYHRKFQAWAKPDAAADIVAKIAETLR